MSMSWSKRPRGIAFSFWKACDSAHLHAATTVGSGSSQYTASYDISGNMTCRASSDSTTCSGTQTGAQLGYDNEGRFTTWQNTPTSPTSTDKYLYDGEGNRVEQQVTSGGTTTTTYVGALEAVAVTGSSRRQHDHHDVLLRGRAAHRACGQRPLRQHALVSGQ